MKKWIGFGLLLVVLFLGSYFVMGDATEIILKRNMDALRQSKDIQVVLQNYQRGWFRSHAQLIWTITLPPEPQNIPNQRTVLMPQRTYRMEIPLDIYHGPIIVTGKIIKFGLGYAQSQIFLPPIYEKHFTPIVNAAHGESRPLIDVSLFVNYFAKCSIQLDMPAFGLRAKDGQGNFYWSGMSSDFSFSRNRKKLEGSLSIQGMHWLGEGITGNISAIKSEYRVEQNVYDLYTGEAQLAIPLFSLMRDKQLLLQLKDIDIASESSISNDLFHSSITGEIKEVMHGDQTYGKSTFKLSLDNFDAKTLASIKHKQLTEDMKKNLFFSFLAELPPLLSHGAKLTISELELNLPHGHFVGSLNLSMPNELVSNPFLLVQKMEGGSELKISKGVLFNGLQKIIRKKNDRYSSQSNFAANQCGRKITYCHVDYCRNGNPNRE